MSQKVVGIDLKEYDPIEVMLATEEYNIRREMLWEKNTGATMNEAFLKIKEDHRHPSLKPVLEKVLHELYPSGP